MLQLIVYTLLIFLTLLAVCDIVGACLESEGNKKRIRVCSAPYYFLKNRLKGMKTLKEETQEAPAASEKPYTISETV